MLDEAGLTSIKCKLKGTVPRDFRLQDFFSGISFLQVPEYTTYCSAVSNFFENSQRYSQLKVHQQSDIFPIICPSPALGQSQIPYILRIRTSNIFLFSLPSVPAIIEQMSLKVSFRSVDWRAGWSSHKLANPWLYAVQ